MSQANIPHPMSCYMNSRHSCCLHGMHGIAIRLNLGGGGHRLLIQANPFPNRGVSSDPARPLVSFVSSWSPSKKKADPPLTMSPSSKNVTVEIGPDPPPLTAALLRRVTTGPANAVTRAPTPVCRSTAGPQLHPMQHRLGRCKLIQCG